MTDTPLKPLPDSASENVPRRMVRPLTTRLLIALVVALIVTGCAFWSGYTTLRGPAGWVGARRTTPGHLSSIQYELAKYHDEHGVYPETLREIYIDMTNEDYKRWITAYRHPVEYGRTDSGWQIIDFGADGKPGGIGLDTDMVVTNTMDEDAIVRELHSGKYNATFEQVQTCNDGSYFRNLLVTCLIFGILVFGFTLHMLNSLKTNHIAASVVAAILITIAAFWVGGVMTMVHSIATGH